MRQAENPSAQEILKEGLSRLPGAEALQMKGRPEQKKCPSSSAKRSEITKIAGVFAC
jgi:hypothetical protein